MLKGARLSQRRESQVDRKCKHYSTEGKGILAIRRQGINTTVTPYSKSYMRFIGKDKKRWLPPLGREATKNWARGRLYIVGILMGSVWDFPGRPGIGGILWPDFRENSRIGRRFQTQGLVGFCGLSLGFCSVRKSLAAYISTDWNLLITAIRVVWALTETTCKGGLPLWFCLFEGSIVKSRE